MKLIHLSDLHLGKRVNEFSMLEDQEYILSKIVHIIDATQAEVVLIAGDIYDKSVPSTEAVALFDHFLVQLSQRHLQVFVISGNHDSPERIAFGNRLMDQSGIHMSPVFDGTVWPFSLKDAYGVVDIYMLPFLKPAHVRRYYPEDAIASYTDAMRLLIDRMDSNPAHRNILVTHQFVTGALRSDSEEISVGGSDHVDATVFANFDYVALGHIHAPQTIGTERIRYCGTPLKYSFSEAKQEKSVTIVTLEEKGTLLVNAVPLSPKHDMREIRGTYMELTAKSYYEGSRTDDYLHITLTDEEDIPNAIGNLRVIYPQLMKLDYDNKRTRNHTQIDGAEAVEQKTPLELFSEFYEKQNNQAMNEEQRKCSEALIKQIWEDEA